MNSYVKDTRFAATQLIDLLHREQLALEELEEERDSINRRLATFREFLRAADFDDEGIPGGVQAAFTKYMDANEVAKGAFADMTTREQRLKAAVQTKESSLPTLAGALLQIAKQGISFVHGGLANCPPGRAIGSEAIKNVIWQARNQALHFEDGNPHPPVRACFQQLAQDFGAKFDLVQRRTDNLAFDVVVLLGWQTYEAYERDMSQILP